MCYILPLKVCSSESSQIIWYIIKNAESQFPTRQTHLIRIFILTRDSYVQHSWETLFYQSEHYDIKNKLQKYVLLI